MSISIRDVVRALYQARSFEEAADQVLGVMMDMAERVLSETGTRVLRGMVHLRPDGSYAGLAVREAGGAGDGEGGALRMPSTTAWHWVERARDAVLLDVRAGVARDAGGAVMEGAQRQRPEFRSRSTLLGREVALVAALPLRRPGGRVDGFVSLELATEGDLPLWPALAGELQVLADVAASFLCELPRAPREDVQGDRWLPVVGKRMRASIRALRLFAKTDETILLQGETGVGKSQLARWCYAQSARAGAPFESVNLSAEPEELRPGALFGWTKGAFTGAFEPRQGLVRKAEGGTLFIDEIDKLPRRGQTMLLQLLDEGRFRVIGEDGERHANVRFIVGTNANLEVAMREGRFLEDLYHRIRVMPMRLPPLRERRDEIGPWAEYMITGLHEKGKRPGEARLEAAAGALLEGQDWPGNLRQLHSVIKRAYAFAAEDAQADVWVRVAHVQSALAFEVEPAPDALWTALEQAASAFVQQALVQEEGLHLDLADAFRGFVLEEAVARLGARDAFRVLGREKAVQGGNQGKVLAREKVRMDELAAILGRKPS